MKQIRSDIITFRGSHYEFGYHQGSILKETPLYAYQQKHKERNRRRYSVSLQDAFRMFRGYHDGIWEELTGLSDALKLSMEEVLFDYSGFQQEWIKSGCSIVAGDDYLVRNYDYHPKTYEGRFLLFQPKDKQFYATIGPSQRVVGRIDGMNEAGLTIGYNFVHRRSPEEGFICNMLARIVLERCESSEDAAAMLADMPHRHSFNYLLNDKSGSRIVVEGSPRGTAVKRESYSTNHFDVLQKENRHHLVDSKRRLAIIEKAYPKLQNGEQAFDLLNNPKHDVFSDSYRNWAGTIHTSVYFPKQLEMRFTIGNESPVTVDFGSWLQGEELSINAFHGSIDTEVKTPFMGD